MRDDGVRFGFNAAAMVDFATGIEPFAKHFRFVTAHEHNYALPPAVVVSYCLHRLSLHTAAVDYGERHWFEVLVAFDTIGSAILHRWGVIETTPEGERFCKSVNKVQLAEPRAALEDIALLVSLSLLSRLTGHRFEVTHARAEAVSTLLAAIDDNARAIARPTT